MQKNDIVDKSQRKKRCEGSQQDQKSEERTSAEVFRKKKYLADIESRELMFAWYRYHGYERLLIDLGIRLGDRRALLFAWKCEARKPCMLLREEFMVGLKALNVNSIDDLHKALTKINYEH